MIFELKKISPSEFIFFFPQPLPLTGTFYANRQTSDHSLPEIIINLLAGDIAAEILLTNNFIYLHSVSPEMSDDLQSLALAELDDWLASAPAPLIAPQGQQTENKIPIILKTIIAPFMQQDGGDIKLLSCRNGVVAVQFLGKCHGCPYAERTLKERVEKNLIRYLPEIREVIMQ